MLQVLEMAGAVESFADSLPLYACFNPYFPDKGDLAAEKQRLEQKLRHSGSLVKGIYLQVDHLPAIQCSQRALPCSYYMKARPPYLDKHHLLGSCPAICPGNRRALPFQGCADAYGR